MQAFINCCYQCGEPFDTARIRSTLGVFCSHECANEAAGVVVSPGRKVVKSRVVSLLPPAGTTATGAAGEVGNG